MIFLVGLDKRHEGTLSFLASAVEEEVVHFPVPRTLIGIEMINEVSGRLLRTVFHFCHLPTLVCNAECVDGILPSLSLTVYLKPTLCVYEMFGCGAGGHQPNFSTFVFTSCSFFDSCFVPSAVASKA